MAEPSASHILSRSRLEHLLRNYAYPEIPMGQVACVEWQYDREGWLDGATVVLYNLAVKPETEQEA